VTSVTLSVSSSFLCLSTSTISPFPPHFAQPTCVDKSRSPSSRERDVGPNQTLKTRTRCISPFPFQRDAGGSSSLDGGLGEGKTRGGTQGMGGPCSASRKRTTMNVVARFLHSFLYSIQLTASTQCQTTRRQSTRTIRPSTTPITHRGPFPNKPRLRERRYRQRAGLANATTTRPNDEGQSPTTKGRA